MSNITAEKRGEDIFRPNMTRVLHFPPDLAFIKIENKMRSQVLTGSAQMEKKCLVLFKYRTDGILNVWPKVKEKMMKIVIKKSHMETNLYLKRNLNKI